MGILNRHPFRSKAIGWRDLSKHDEQLRMKRIFGVFDVALLKEWLEVSKLEEIQMAIVEHESLGYALALQDAKKASNKWLVVAPKEIINV